MKYDKDHDYRCNLYITKIKQFNTRIFNQFLNEIGCTDFTCEQSFILQALWKQNALTCNELSARTGLAPNTITALVNNLIKSGMVQRKPSSDDRRKVIVTATARGLDAKKDFDRVLSRIISIGFDDFTSDEYEQFQGYLERICSHYEKFFNKDKEESL